MGRSGGKKQKDKKTKKTKKGNNDDNNNNDGSMIWVDPARVRFQHSRIRPYFSGCGRSVHETLESIRQGEILAADLPPIQVIVGPNDTTDNDPWYFSLNNRRLWVLKRCREEGLLESNNHQVQVRVRSPKSTAEAERYSVENCALEAKLMKESAPSRNSKEQPPEETPPPKKLDQGENISKEIPPTTNSTTDEVKLGCMALLIVYKSIINNLHPTLKLPNGGGRYHSKDATMTPHWPQKNACGFRIWVLLMDKFNVSIRKSMDF
ncbi:expressed unknown protein [Seminavis robusta]|uniref:Uncharacterized protein n=1 Tax=Seminavis robusta TaxID=568900 RepID=A0A9N8HDN4_9STRA|nr:expressed unknown protein [Seminavis robusta]|eukprot:Sro351_g123950.1 n/a (264) ;mRNA; f:35752-36703